MTNHSDDNTVSKPRILLGVLAGYLAWWVLSIAGYSALRRFWPGYVELEPAFAFTAAMLAGRLGLAVLCSLLAGAVAVAMARRYWTVTLAIGLVVVLQFVPVQIRLWRIAPVWYQLSFIASVIPCVLLGGLVTRPKASRVQ